jgi:hypothetical protein
MKIMTSPKKQYRPKFSESGISLSNDESRNRFTIHTSLPDRSLNLELTKEEAHYLVNVFSRWLEEGVLNEQK